jgi:DNA-binding transcriptional regulator YdaS (Cro superfamily)
MTEHRTLLEEAVKLAGSQAKLAEKIGLSQQGVSYIMNRSEAVPAEVAVAIDRFTEGKISKRELRPDLFGEAA